MGEFSLYAVLLYFQSNPGKREDSREKTLRQLFFLQKNKKKTCKVLKISAFCRGNNKMSIFQP
jgi:hypothetical protein